MANEDIQFSAGIDFSGIKQDLNNIKGLVQRTAREASKGAAIEFPINSTKLVKEVASAAKTARQKLIENLGADAISQISGRGYANLAGLKQPQNIAAGMQGGNVAQLMAGEERLASARSQYLADFQTQIRARYAEQDKLEKASYDNAVSVAQARQVAGEKARKAELSSLQADIKARYTTEDNLNKALDKVAVQRRREEAVAARDAAKEEQQRINSLPRLRYALYDVASAAQQTGAAFSAFYNSSIQASTSFESSFTAVARASGVGLEETSTNADKLRKQLIGLSREIPMAFSEISNVATLGAQLGVASDDLKQFTTTVTQFSTATGVSAEDTARAFGALGELLNLTSDDYNNLGSSIAFAGVNAVATESEIISVATAIAGVGTQAGLSSDYTVGLSTALASLRVPAEQSRGALTRMFQEINRAATINPKAMNEFADVLGVTTAEANKLATTDMETFFNKFIDGMARVSAAEGPNAITAQLDALNLSDIRITNTITRLAGNTDLMKKSISDATQAFGEGTYLTETFALKADDLASKFQMVQNALDELSAAIGDTIAPVVGAAADAIKSLINFLTDLTNNPIGKTVVFVATAFSALAAAVLTVVSAAVAFSASYIAMRVAVNEINKNGGTSVGIFRHIAAAIFGIDVSAKKATTSLIGLATAEQRASVAGSGFGKSLQANAGFIKANIAGMGALQKATAAAGWVGIALGALTLVSTAWNAIADATENANNANKKYAEGLFGSTTALAEAMAQDAANQPSATLDVAITATTPDAANDYAASISGVVDAQAKLKTSTDSTTESIDAQTVAYGTNTKEALKDLLMQVDGFDKLIKKGGIIEQLGGSGSDYVAAILGDPVNGGEKYVSQLIATLSARVPDIQNILQQYSIHYDKQYGSSIQLTNEAIQSLASQMGISEAAARKMLNALLETGKVGGAVSTVLRDSADAANTDAIANEGLAKATAQVSDETNNAASSFEKFKENFNNAFGDIDSLVKFGSSLETLINGIDSVGTSFDTMSSGGAQNLVNFRQAIYDSIDAASSLGVSTAASIGMVFAQLQQQGVNTAQLLSQLKQMGYATEAAGLETVMSGQFAGLTGAYNAMKNAYKGGGDQADKTQKKIRTLTDVSNDFAKVWKRAFDIRFGKQDALDKIEESWNNIRDSIKQSESEIKRFQKSVDSLTADKALTEYFLRIAEAYGDTIAIAKYRAELEGINNDLTEANQGLADAQAASSKTLVGNTKAAIANRNTIRSMLGGYSSYIQALISSGASQDTVNAAIRQSQEDFHKQATEAGFAAEELMTYEKTFADMAKASKSIDYTVSYTVAGKDPAMLALRELEVQANAAGKDRTMKISTSVDYKAIQKFSRGMKLAADLADLQGQYAAFIGKEKGRPAAIALKKQIDSISNQLSSGNFATGGYTGAGGKYQVAGIVHRGEYVVPKEQVNQQTGMPYFMSQPRSFAQGGYAGAASGPSTIMVELSPYDRKLLAQAGNVQLRLDGKLVAQNTNANNTTAANRGSN